MTKTTEPVEKVTIVVVSILEIRTGQTYAGRPFGPQKLERMASAAVWLTKGSPEDLKQAQAWAAREGYQVFTCPVDVADPLGWAKAKALAEAGAQTCTESG